MRIINGVALDDGVEPYPDEIEDEECSGMTCREYKDQFIAHLVAKGVTAHIALQEYEAMIENDPAIVIEGQPEADADEAISYWEA